MSKTAKGPKWHTKDSAVHHDNAKCKAAKREDVTQKLPNDGGKPLCPECGALNNQP